MGQTALVGYEIVFELLALETCIYNWGPWFVWIQLRETMTFCYVHTSHKISWQGNLWNNVCCFEAVLLLSIFQLRTDFPNNRCLFSIFICAKSSSPWVARGGHKCQNHGLSPADHCLSAFSPERISFEIDMTVWIWGDFHATPFLWLVCCLGQESMSRAP